MKAMIISIQLFDMTSSWEKRKLDLQGKNEAFMTSLDLDELIRWIINMISNETDIEHVLFVNSMHFITIS